MYGATIKKYSYLISVLIRVSNPQNDSQQAVRSARISSPNINIRHYPTQSLVSYH